jgi:hypothetical protein
MSNNTLISLQIKMSHSSLPLKEDAFLTTPQNFTDEEQLAELLPSVVELHHCLRQMMDTLTSVENVFFKPQTVTIYGFNYLRGNINQPWQTRLNTLFFDADLPLMYILKSWTEEQPNDYLNVPFKVTVQCITYSAKQHVYSVLKQYSQSLHSVFIED